MYIDIWYNDIEQYFIKDTKYIQYFFNLCLIKDYNIFINQYLMFVNNLEKKNINIIWIIKNINDFLLNDYDKIYSEYSELLIQRVADDEWQWIQSGYVLQKKYKNINYVKYKIFIKINEFIIDGNDYILINYIFLYIRKIINNNF